MKNIIRILFQPIGGWRSSFLWRAYGFVVITSTIHRASRVTTWAGFWEISHGYHFAILSAAVLFLFGPRIITLLFSAISICCWLTPLMYREVEFPIDDDSVLVKAIVLVGALLVCYVVLLFRDKSWKIGKRKKLSGKSFDETIDDVTLSLFRISAVAMMFFTAIHKVNADFFNSDYSCAQYIINGVMVGWRFFYPPGFIETQPFLCVLGELLVAGLLMSSYRIGLIFTFLVMGFVGHDGPAPFVLVVFLTALGFLKEQDGKIILEGFKKYWIWLFFGIWLWGSVSSRLYNGWTNLTKYWVDFYYFQTIIILGIFGIGYLILKEKKVSFSVEQILPRNPKLKKFLVAYLVLSAFMYMTPYFGLKFRYSFAMYSNLRVDNNRWNSYLFPSWLKIGQHDHFIRLRNVEIHPEDKQKYEPYRENYHRWIRPGMVSPISLENRINHMREAGVRLSLGLRYQNKDYYFENVTENKDFEKFLSYLPKSKFYQPFLEIVGPQPCVL